MKFIDEASVKIVAGRGGHGCVSFRREKFIEFGGPDGGNGGKGGDVIFQASRNFNTLAFFRYRALHRAAHGGSGSGQRMQGASGQDLILTVPLGTQICDSDDNLLCELTAHDQEYLVARGGRGGQGNASFKSSTNKSPRKATQGEPGEELELRLRLSILADFGIIGQPNSGKSTLLNNLTNADSKVADYAFTTTRPHLGVVLGPSSEVPYTLADVPGIIAGASDGVGLGHRFLRHISRCCALLHVIDASADINAAYTAVREELHAYDVEHNAKLCAKPEVVILNKTDLTRPEELCAKIAGFPHKAVTLSLKDGSGLQDVYDVIRELGRKRPVSEEGEFMPESGYKP